MKDLIYRQLKVITSQLIAKKHNRNVKRIVETFNNNKERFKEGKDYFTITRENSWVENLDLGIFTNNNQKEAYLWTESGYLKLVRSWNDDKSWSIYETLIETYFKAKQEVRDVALKAERQKSKKIRSGFTATLQEHGYKMPIEYIKTTCSMKKKLGIKGNKKKDNFDLIELCKIQAAESVAMINIMQNEASGYEQVKPLCDLSCQMVEIAIGHGQPMRKDLLR